MRVFLIEDNIDLNEFITTTFKKLDYNIVSCNNGADAFKYVDQFFDLYLIDINLPNINGLELVKKIKSNHTDSMIFIISGDDNIETILKAYNLGCNDYIKKPFDLRELIAKINVLFRDKLEKEIKITDFCYYDRDSNIINYKNKPIKLTKKESALIEILLKNYGKIVANNTIEDFVWGEGSEKGHVRQLVSKLKKKLPCENVIQNHSSNGYGVGI
ncbi:MAG: response regulator transcription factor [Campylobacterales bacterium]|nr:response regulator transcription factor [Campylobacterales bacterium]